MDGLSNNEVIDERYEQRLEPAGSPGAGEEGQGPEEGERSAGALPASLEKLRSRLLDLSARNRLLNFSHARSKRFVRVIDELPDQLFAKLTEEKSMRFAAVPEPTEKQLLEHGYLQRDEATGLLSETGKLPGAEEWAARLGMASEHELPQAAPDVPDPRKHADNTIQTLYYPAELEARLQIIHGQSRLALEETGANVLFLAFGFLEWDESLSGRNSPRLAPLMLLPVRLEKDRLNPDTATFEYRVEYSGEDILTNLSLRERLKRDFAIALPSIAEGLLPEEYFARIRETVLKAKPEWKLHRYVSLGLFEFGKLMMYLDLDPARWQGRSPLEHPLVRRLTGAAGPEEREAPVAAAGFCREHAIDELENVHSQFPLIDDADSSQHSALVDVIRGDDLVIEGPPGTGKSQTITNLIAASLAQGKKVLFVAEKRAALEVVKNRLVRAGLGDFCLELHSHKSQKQAVVASIRQRIQRRGGFRSPERLAALIGDYERFKTRLNGHVERLHTEFEGSGLSVHQVLMQATRLREALGMRPSEFHPLVAEPDALLAVDRNRLQEQAGFYPTLYTKAAAEAGQAGRLETHPWFGCGKIRLGAAERAALLERLAQACASLGALAEARDALADELAAPELAGFGPDALADLAGALPSLPTPRGDEDWALIGRLDSRSCAALGSWLQRLETLLQQQSRLARRLRPDAIASTELLGGLREACAQLRQHSDDEALSLNDLLAALRNTRALLGAAAPVHALLRRLAEQGSLPELGTDLTGLEQLACLLRQVQALPAELAGLRHRRFEDEALDAVLDELAVRLPTLHELREQAGEAFDLERLPELRRLEDLARVLADPSLFRWFKGSWRATRNEVLQLLRPGLGVDEALAALPAAIGLQRGQAALNADPLFRETLGERFRGLDTRLEPLQRLRAWYRALRAECGRGFGPRVWIADYLLQADTDFLRGLREEAVALQDYLAQVEGQRQAFERLLPYDVHALRSARLLDPQGLFVRLIRELGKALKQLLLLIREQEPSLGGMLELVRAVEQWQAAAAALQGDALVAACLGEQALTRIEDALTAGPRLSAWRHSVAFATPLLATPLRERLLDQLAAGDSRAGEARILRWREAGLRLGLLAETWERDCQAFFEAGDILPEEWWQPLEERDFPGLTARLAAAAERQDLLEHWFEYRRLRGHLTELGFAAVVTAIERQRLEPRHCADACLLGLLDAWATRILEENPALGQFSGKEQEAIRERFAEIDNRLKLLQREQIAARIDRNPIPPGNNSGRVRERTQLALLEHEAGKQRRHEPIRSLVDRAAEALQGLMPCFMMSPMAVAQYLPAGRLEFDLVVMDEASQIRPEESLGSIARARQLVVVGDPKQLPPTNFFARQGDDEEDDDATLSLAEDAESILDAALPLFKLRRLRWHYRSRHESLIAFSNAAFYDGNLVVYPSPHRESAEFGVKFTRIDGGRFLEQRNPEEAEVVVRAIEQHLLHSPGESLGVVAMNLKQAEQIERLLELRTKQDPLLQAAWERNQAQDEPLFVKNLENVQGDERDVIFISCTYGPVEAGGRLPQRFGPINGVDGWRRLNVLFTRSKKRMQVFASFGAGDVLVSGTASRGLKALRDFLQYAESGRMPLLSESGRAPDSDFEVAVIDALARHGYDCEAQVGVAGFFIDLAVRDPGQPGRYLMGIECDGAAYHSAKSARDRDRLRQSVLEQLGWRIRRIWSVDWFRNPRAQLEPILQELASLRSAPAPAEPVVALAEESAIRQEAKEVGEQATPETADSLRERLLCLDGEIIRRELPDIPEERRLLRPELLEALLEIRPRDRTEYQEQIPGYLRAATAPEEARFLDDVLGLIGEHG
ncbi:DUF4011 domain-containing anti-phage protein Hhe [Azotobacter armeniacus]